MAVPPGTPRVVRVTVPDGSGENRVVWPAGVDGLCLAPQVVEDENGPWILVHATSGRFLCVARDMHRSLRVAAGFGYAADWTRPLDGILADPSVSETCVRVMRELR